MSRTALPSVDQPPDPCALLTVAAINSAFDVGARAPAPSKLAVGTDQRDCFWFTASGLLSLTVITAASHRALCAAEVSAVNGAPGTNLCRPLHLPDLFFPLTLVSSLGDQAGTHVDGHVVDLDVLDGSTLLMFEASNIQAPNITVSLEDLARVVIGRLPN